MGRTKTLPLATTLLSNLGDCATTSEMTSKALLFGMHLKRSNPPQLSSFGNDKTRILLNSSQEQSMSGTSTFFSPKPAATNASRSRTVFGTLLASLLLRQNTFTVQLWTFFGFLLYGPKFDFCSAVTCALWQLRPRRSLIERNASTARLHELLPLCLTPTGEKARKIDKAYAPINVMPHPPPPPPLGVTWGILSAYWGIRFRAQPHGRGNWISVSQWHMHVLWWWMD